MNIEVYCDEAYPDFFSSQHPQARYLIIGGIWLKSDDRDHFKAPIHDLRNQHKIGGEFKWTKVSPSKIGFYKDLLTWYFNQGENLRFRCIAIDHQQMEFLSGLEKAASNTASMKVLYGIRRKIYFQQYGRSESTGSRRLWKTRMPSYISVGMGKRRNMTETAALHSW